MTEKKLYQSKTIMFFSLVLAAGGLDIIDNLVRKQDIGWRDVVLALIGIVGIALRMITNKPVKL